MALSEFCVRLQYGITGGFAPPTPSAIHTLIKASESDDITIESMVQSGGTPELNSLGDKTVTADQSIWLIEELYEILKNLPTEQPPGSEDIYGLDASIMWSSEHLQWINGGPQGCGGGTSEVTASTEQKAMFKRAVEIVQELVNS